MTKLKQELIENNTSIIWSLEDFFTVKKTKGVLSLEAAASWWGFGEMINQKWEVAVPRGYNGSMPKTFIKKQFKLERYLPGIETFVLKDSVFRVYSPERTIVELIKKSKGHFNDVLVQTINNFVKTIKYNFNKIIEFAKMFKVETETRIAFAMAQHG